MQREPPRPAGAKPSRIEPESPMWVAPVGRRPPVPARPARRPAVRCGRVPEPKPGRSTSAFGSRSSVQRRSGEPLRCPSMPPKRSLRAVPEPLDLPAVSRHSLVQVASEEALRDAPLSRRTRRGSAKLRHGARTSQLRSLVRFRAPRGVFAKSCDRTLAGWRGHVDRPTRRHPGTRRRSRSEVRNYIGVVSVAAKT